MFLVTFENYLTLNVFGYFRDLFTLACVWLISGMFLLYIVLATVDDVFALIFCWLLWGMFLL